MFKKTLSAFLCLTLSLSLFISSSQTAAAGYFFKDISNHWAAQDIEQLRLNCGINGYKDKNGNLTYLFQPDKLVSRAELAMMLIQCHQQQLLIPNSAPFPDVDKGNWAAPAIYRGKNLGWFSGYPDGNFRPNNPVNRAEAVKMIISSFYTQTEINKYTIKQTTFLDIPTDSWFAIFVYFASNKNFVQGYKDSAGKLTYKFGPERNMTRAEAAKVIMRALNENKGLSNTDNNSSNGSTTDNTSSSSGSTDQNSNTGTTPTQDSQQQNPPLPSDPVVQVNPGPIVSNQNHPRLWVTANDLPRLRAWAKATNPVYQNGLLVMANAAKKDVDEGKMSEDTGSSNGGNKYHRETYAMLFAYMSLIENDESVRNDYAQRAKKLLMEAMNEAVKGIDESKPYRSDRFATHDRAHFYGEAWGLTVDWIYPYLSTQDKATIRTVFIQWSEQISNSSVTGEYAHPTPVGTINDPILLHLNDLSKFALRFSSNNHFTFHMRNMGLMAMSLDPADDPDNKLGGYLKRVTGAWLYMTDYLLRELSKGGNGTWTEGKQYTPSGMGSVVHLMLAFKTANLDPAVYGKQIILTDNPFWSNVIPAYIHALSPLPKLIFNFEWLGPTFEIASFGDADKVIEENSTKIFGALGLYNYYSGNTKGLNDARWIEINAAPGGASQKIPRIANSLNSNYSPRNAILSFMLFDPTAAEPADPRPSLPLVYFGEGMNRLLARTGWTADATWVSYILNWNKIDHQQGDGNMFEFYANGEYLTKNWVGYGPRVASSDFHNSLTLENDPLTNSSPGSFQSIQSINGSQWQYTSAGDPKLLAKSIANNFIYLTGDATNLYNTTSDNATDIVEASRSFVWLKPNHIVVYDRAESKTANRFKRFWLNLASQPTIQTIAGNIQSMITTAKGQKFYITTLLPANASVTSTNQRPAGSWGDETAAGETMNYRLKVEAPGGPQKTRFLHVLQGTTGTASTTTLIQSVTDNMEGAVVDQTAIMFSINSSSSPSQTTYYLPSNTTKQIITGLKVNSGYTVTVQNDNNQLKVDLSEGGSQMTDAGGVLVYNQ